MASMWVMGLMVLSTAGAAMAGGEVDLRAAVEQAPLLHVEEVCAPIRTTRGGQPELVPNPDGQTYDLLLRYFCQYWGPHTTVIIDLATGEVKKHLIENALFGWGTLGPDGKAYQHLIMKGGVFILRYDPAKNDFEFLPDKAPVGGEVMPMTVGTDGMIYGGGSRESKACSYQLDPATGRITKDYGTMGPSHAPNACWGYSIAADDDYVYMASGKIPWYIVALSKKTGKDEVLHTMDDPRGHVTVSQQRYGCTATSQGHGKIERFWLYQGKAIPMTDPKEKPPWPQPEKVEPWVKLPPRPELGLAGAVPKADGKVRIWYCNPGAQAVAPKAALPDAKPQDLGWKCIDFEVPTFPSSVLEILRLDDGRILGAGESYTGNFIYDPATNTAVHTGPLGLSQYCMVLHEGKVYMSGYPSSALYCFDPTRSSTLHTAASPTAKPLPVEHKDSNPRLLTYLAHAGSGCHKMWTAAVGGDGKVYFGGRWYRNGEGGGLGWWDPKAEKGGGISQPFANYQINYICSAAQGRYIVISTNCVRDQATNTPAPETARLFVLDTMRMEIVRHIEPVPKAAFTGAIADAGDGCILGITFDPEERAKAPPKDENGNGPSYGTFDQSSILYKVNVETGAVVWTKRLPYPVGFRSNENADGHDGFDFLPGPDGKIWTYTGARFVPCNPEKKWHYAYLNPVLVRIDPRDGAIEVVGRLSHGGRLAFVGRDLYLSGGCKYLEGKNEILRRIRGVVPLPPR